MNITAVVIDDEYPSMQELIFLLSKFPWLKIIGEARCGVEGANLIRRLNPQLVFLDIRMPDIDGLSLAKEIYNLKLGCKIIFTTAYDQYAIKAFEINAVDYILKPYDEDRVIKSVLRARDVIEQEGIIQPSIPPSTPVNKLPVWKSDKLILLNIQDIFYIFTEGRDILIKTQNETYLCNYSLQELEDKLNSQGFFRSHRSYLVNLDKIVEVSPWFNGSYIVKLNNLKDEVPISRTQSKKFKEIFGI